MTSCCGSSPLSRSSCLALLVYVMVRFNEARQSGADQDDAQLAARSRVDGDTGHHPGGDRHPVVPHPQGAARHPEGRRRREGDRPASGIGRTPIRPIRRSARRPTRPRSRPVAADEGFTFRSELVPKDKIAADQTWLLSADEAMVVPVDKIVKVQVTVDGRYPCLRHAGLRAEDRRRARPAQRDLVQGREGRHLLRPVLAASAATTTPTCRSPSASSARRSMPPGWPTRRRGSPRPARAASAAGGRPDCPPTDARRVEELISMAIAPRRPR